LHEALAASHHLMLAHALALPVIRRNSPGGKVGIALNLSPQVAASPSAEDQALATWQDGYVNRWYLDPLAGRGYPEDAVAGHGDGLEFIEPGDMETIASPIEFLGVNYYNRGIARSTKISEEENAPRTVFLDGEQTEMGWEVHPESLGDLLGRLHKDYAFPALYITENGAAYQDRVGPDETVEDAARLSYIKRHLQAVQKSMAAGCPVKGYFVWSLLDNFEWSYGYTKRFGIIYVDYPSQKRTPKMSAYWYRRVIASGSLEESG
jgi:beta-glucosidase